MINYSGWEVSESTSPDVFFEITKQEKSVSFDMESISMFVLNIAKYLTNEPIEIEYTEEPDLKIIFRKAKKQYNRIYTSGCFDLLHYGHINIFEKSKLLCHELIVGVSTDELIMQEKGSKPLIPFEERIRLVETIKYVDKVIPQTDKNKQAVVDKWNIDAITVGDDWKGKYPPVSCAMVYFPYTPKVSSTILKESIQNGK